MNREIKFRAWGSHDFSMQGDELVPSDEKSMIHFGIINSLDEMHWKPKSLIFMQYTGLKDANGVEIYEGDIVTGGHATDEYAKVYYCEEDSAFKIETEMWRAFFSDLPLLTVHGNIHENPELLTP